MSTRKKYEIYKKMEYDKTHSELIIKKIFLGLNLKLFSTWSCLHLFIYSLIFNNAFLLCASQCKSLPIITVHKILRSTS